MGWTFMHASTYSLRRSLGAKRLDDSCNCIFRYMRRACMHARNCRKTAAQLKSS